MARDLPLDINKISVCGYKSLMEEQSIELRPLTILAGANSSGKSSIMQPLLLIKQTLEASYDPGALLLNGPNVRLTSAKQLLTSIDSKHCAQSFTLELSNVGNWSYKTTFSRDKKGSIDVGRVRYKGTGKDELILEPDMTHDQILQQPGIDDSEYLGESRYGLRVVRDRSFLSVRSSTKSSIAFSIDFMIYRSINLAPTEVIKQNIKYLIHVPSLRGNPERVYKTTSVGNEFPGTFENYVASIIHHWQSTRSKRLNELNEALEELGLTWKVEAKRLDDTQVELRVGRLPSRQGKSNGDLVSIADVGFAVSQVLPVLVALLTADKGQIVYIEQPEIHLHPLAQARLAGVLISAAKRGVIVIAETHSSILLRKVQAFVAKRELNPDLVKLHWFIRNPKTGVTTVSSADLDEEGAFGDWPEDFDEVSLAAEQEYLDAVESRRFND